MLKLMLCLMLLPCCQIVELVATSIKMIALHFVHVVVALPVVVELDTNVRNTRARNLYQRLGYEEIGIDK